MKPLSLLAFICLIFLAACFAPQETASTLVSPTSPPAAQASSTPTSTPPADPAETASPSVQVQATPTIAQPTAAPSPTAAVQDCSATEPDMLGPFYTPGAPVRDRVGEGYLLTGAVLSAADCSPIQDAQIEIWMAGPDGEYRDDYRATLFSDENGAYSFESHIPPPYSGRPPHHHLRVSAPGFQTLVTQHYPQPGINQATFDLVLLPQ